MAIVRLNHDIVVSFSAQLSSLSLSLYSLVVRSRDYGTMGTMANSTNSYVRMVLKKWTMGGTMTK
eukprot:scaffold2192_cov147-Skeletonema_menzelii.AAC.1